MFILSPSILSADFNKLGEQMHILQESGVNYVHIDVMDGHFVPNISFGLPVIKSMNKNKGTLIFDVHLMITDPCKYITRFAEAGADIICFHIESCTNANETCNSPIMVIDKIKALSKKVAIAVKPSTPIQTVFPYLKDISMVLIMSVEPGFGGQLFMTEALTKAEILKKYIDENNLNIDIEMDGGITLDNVSNVIQSGVNVIVAGSAIFNDCEEGFGIKKSVCAFNKKFEEYLS